MLPCLVCDFSAELQLVVRRILTTSSLWPDECVITFELDRIVSWFGSTCTRADGIISNLSRPLALKLLYSMFSAEMESAAVDSVVEAMNNLSSKYVRSLTS